MKAKWIGLAGAAMLAALAAQPAAAQSTVAQPAQPMGGQPPLIDMLSAKLGTMGMMAVVGLVGLVIAGVIVLLVTRKKPSGAPGAAPAPRPQAPKPAKAAPGAPPIPKAPSTGGRAIRITGKGPSNEPIDMQFSADELAGAGVMLGVEGDGQALIPDGRPSPYVSRRHARLFHDGSNFMIEDNKSSNGTFVGAQRLDPVKPRALLNGDRFRLADIELAVAVG